MRHKAHDSGGKFALLLLLCRHIGLLFGKRLDTNLLGHRIPKYPLWFSTLLREFFLRVLRFPLSLKTNISKFQFDPKCTDISERVLVNSLVFRGLTNYIYNYISVTKF